MASDPQVLIVGGGPAGSSLAGLLAMRGRRTLVIERDEFPRFKIGESLLPQSCGTFEKLGLMDALDQRFVRKYGARFVDADTGETVRYRFAEALDPTYAYAFEVERAPFDKLLLDRAVELGAEVLQPCKVTEVLFEGERAVGLRVRDGDGEREIRAPLVVDATGRGSMLASRMRGKGRLAGLETSALFAHYRGIPRAEGEEAGDITVVLGKKGWMWFIPFRSDISSVGIVLTREGMAERRSDESLEAFFVRTLDGAEWAKERLLSAERVTPVRSAADFSYSVERMAGDGWLCVGDANGFIDPLFSSGVHLAVRGADLAATAIDEALDHDTVDAASFEQFERRIRSASSMFLGIVQGNYEGRLTGYLFAKEQRKLLRQLITTILSGDVFHDEPEPKWVRFMRGHMPAVM